MKKRSLKTLSLNKKKISDLDENQLKGAQAASAGSGLASCNNYSLFASCNGICHSFVCR